METTTTQNQDSMEQLIEALKAVTAGGRRIVGHFGALSVEGEPHSWWYLLYDEAIPKLLATPEYKVAQVLSALGSEVRLALLRALLEAPRTVAELVAELHLGTTGQAYHHLRELERAGYVEQRGGKYHFDFKVGRVYLTALALAADAGSETLADETKRG
jgi:DNA-binding transcriptional ArsR family regulator